MLICCCYRPPSSNAEYLNDICMMIQRVSDLNCDVFILADMNIDWFSHKCSLKKTISDTIVLSNLCQLINVPTRAGINQAGLSTSTCIDHIYTNCAEKCTNVCSEPVSLRDHNIVSLVLKTKVPKVGPKGIHKRMYKLFKEEDFVCDMARVQWDEVLSQTHAEMALEMFCELFSSICDKHAPVRKVTVRSSRAPWLDADLQQLMKERDKNKKAAITSGNSADWIVYRSLRNKVTKMNRQKKKQYYQTKFKQCSNNSKHLWSTINTLLGRCKGNEKSFIEVDGAFITKPSEIANYFNDYYKSKVSSIIDEMPSVNGQLSERIIKKQIMNNKDCQFTFESVRENEIEKLLTNIKCNKPCGIDNMDGRLLKIAAKAIVKPVCHIFNLCTDECLYPDLWKISKVIPLLKHAKEPLTGQNSRPISILPVLGKMMEGVVFKQIQNYFNANNIFSDAQHAYKEGFSTCTALTALTDDWLRQIDGKLLVGAVFLDFSAAFDIVDHVLLLKKLLNYGFNESAVRLISSYLANRKQCVAFNGSLSNIVTLNCGIPQGSCLGPLLYSIFVNDMSYALRKAQMTVYADDTTISVSSVSLNQVNDMLQQELMSISEWVVENKLKLNVLKTKCMLLGSNYSVRGNPELHISL
uniref:Reverse transcriptase domain-containing protein n=1 Tax=Oryzias melastigma TaxID=30732 RepID=A0A3B3CXC8_ORYME